MYQSPLETISRDYQETRYFKQYIYRLKTIFLEFMMYCCPNNLKQNT